MMSSYTGVVARALVHVVRHQNQTSTATALFLLASIALPASAQPPTCQAVESDRILARDLAAVLPEFRAVLPETLLAQAPLPGSQRIFHSPELLALSHRFGIVPTSAPDTCFEWAMQPLDRSRVLEAMNSSLQIAAAQIEIADMITSRVPPGRIEFSLSRLGTPASPEQRAPVLWRGDVVYGEGHRFAIWARVGITAPCRKLIAVGNLKAGQPIEARQLRATTATCFPVSAKEAPPIEEAAGMVPLRAVPAGSELRPEFLVPPNDVNRGDAVRVEVRSGAARLAITGRALSGGRSGETISIRNPESNRIFQARVTGKGTALVEAGLKGS
jgi:flagella basal body P-ring formation protein FlgA